MTLFLIFFFFNDTATTEIYTLSLHDALPILHFSDADQRRRAQRALEFNKPLGFFANGIHIAPGALAASAEDLAARPNRSEEHTSELQSQSNLVCRLLLEKKKRSTHYHYISLP